MSVFTQLLSVGAMFAGGYGSCLFVDSVKKPANFELGAKVFLAGNAANVAIGLSIGDMSLVCAQAGLVYYTISMLQDKKYLWYLAVGFITAVYTIGIASKFHFTADLIGVIAAVLAIIGAWAMDKGKFTLMSWMWVVADLAFIYIAIINRLPGLGLLAMVFVYHGALRLLGLKRDGLFTFTK